ncbi:hypothetical protein SAMCCGM7_Ch3157 [Sinorhizobium americanum CCGM7]|nr:hypothetical protein SAMCCGM7_Ch3157 [Sinorhizobium americanum CCGM7]
MRRDPADLVGVATWATNGDKHSGARSLLLSRCGAFLPAAPMSPLDFRPVIWYPLL